MTDTKDRGAVGNVYYGNHARGYDAKRSQTKRWQYENRAVEKFLDKLPPGLSVLDIPCGTGRFFPLYSRKQLQVTGVDISRDMLAQAAQCIDPKDTQRYNLLLGDALNIAFAENTFDVIVCVRFLQNIIPLGEVKIALREMARVARSHSILQVEIRKEGLPRSQPPSDDRPMRSWLYQPEIEHIVREAGFDITTIENVVEHKESKFAMLFCAKR